MTLKQGSLGSLIFCMIFGSVFVMFAAFMYRTTAEFAQTAMTTNATITRIESGNDEHNVYVTYKINEQTYNTRLNEYNSSMHEGQEIEILYQPNNPNNIQLKGDIGPWFSLIFGGAGLLVIVLGFFAYKKQKQNMELKENGKRIQAIVKNIAVGEEHNENNNNNNGINIGGFNVGNNNQSHTTTYYNIICEYADPFSGEIHTFKSERLYVQPNVSLNTPITVYVDENNYKKYHVDIDCLMNHIQSHDVY